MHTVKETDMIAVKLDLLIKKMEERSKQPIHAPIYAMGSHFTCDVCGNDGHSGNDCPETREDCAYLNNNNNNGYCPQQGGQGWNQPRPPFQGGNNYNPSYNSNFNSNQPPLRELVLGQVKINENINKKHLANDKSLESLNVKLETLSSTLKNQSSFNKTVESLLAQIAASIPVSENVKAVTTRGGKSTRDPPHPNHAGKAPATQEEVQPTDQEETREPEKGTTPQDYIETSLLPFPTRNKKATMDEQFTHFVEMIQKIHVNVPLLDVMHVPTYARYIKD